MRILFCDDDPLVTRQLEEYVREFFTQTTELLPEFAAYTSGDELLRQEQKADIAFLDVEMPGQSGIHIASQLKLFHPRIKIFIVTSFPDYLDDAMRCQVFRYLSKPVDKHRLFRNLKDALYQYSIDTREYAIVTNSGVCTRRAEEIVCVEAVSRKTFIHTTEETLQSTETMEYWRKTLDLPCFYSPHRSFIINMRYVSKINKDTIFLRAGSLQKSAYLARRKYNTFKDTYLMYVESIR